MLALKYRIGSYFWPLPHGHRRAIFRVCRPRAYAALQKLRATALKPFIERKAIFVHVPKCAGVSLTAALFDRTVVAHWTIRNYQIAFSEADFNSYFKFTVVRNPWDRVLSAYSFLKMGGHGGSDFSFFNNHIARYGSFSEFVEGWLNRRNIYKGLVFFPQHFFICPFGLTPCVDFIGHFETLEQDFAIIRARVHPEVQLPHRNRSTGRTKNYQEYYTDEARRIVAEVYREDIAMLGYTFDGSPPTRGVEEADETPEPIDGVRGRSPSARY